MAQPIENYLPGVRDNGGLVTNEAATFNSSVSIAGALNSYANVLSKTAATTLTAAQSGSTVVFASATGFTVTLPAPVVGLNYNFVVANAPTSGSHGVVTDASSTFLEGGISLLPAPGIASGTAATFNADGLTHRSIRMNGTTTGGTVPSWFAVTCVSSTQWMVEGQLAGSGATATPFQLT